MIIKTREREELLRILRARFEKNMRLHAGVDWAAVQARLEGNGKALESLMAMETTGGEPDVMGSAGESGHFTSFDFSPESPVGRRSVCYDAESRLARKENRPEESAVELAAAMGTDLAVRAELARSGDVSRIHVAMLAAVGLVDLTVPGDNIALLEADGDQDVGCGASGEEER